MIKEQVNASVVDGKKVRVTKVSNGATVSVFSITPNATHAIASGDTISVFYRNGVKVHDIYGNFRSISGVCN